MSSLIYTSTKSKTSKRQRAIQGALVKEQREIKNSLKRDLGIGKFGIIDRAPFRRTTKHIPSLGSGVGTAVKADDKVYTGTAIIGIGQMHKSNSVPVFQQEEAKDLARMRR